MLAATLALLASFSWGTADFLGGLQSRRTTPWTAALGSQLVASLALIGVLAIVAHSRPPLAVLAWPLAGGLVGGIGAVLQYRALALTKMSIVSPIIAAAALVPVFWSVVGGEPLGTLRLLGVFLTVGGVVVISRGLPSGVTLRTPTLIPAGDDSPGLPADGLAALVDEPSDAGRAGVLGAIVAAACFGFFLVCLDHGGAADPYWTVAVARTAAVLTLALIAGLGRPTLRPSRAALLPLLVIGLLIAAANVFFTTATTQGYLAIVAVLGWLNPAITIWWARAVLRERLAPLQIAAAVIVFVGVVLLIVG